MGGPNTNQLGALIPSTAGAVPQFPHSGEGSGLQVLPTQSLISAGPSCAGPTWIPPPRLSVRTPRVQASEGTPPSAHGCPGESGCRACPELGSSVLGAAECGQAGQEEPGGTGEPGLCHPGRGSPCSPGSPHLSEPGLGLRKRPRKGPARPGPRPSLVGRGGEDSCARRPSAREPRAPAHSQLTDVGLGLCVWGGGGDSPLGLRQPHFPFVSARLAQLCGLWGETGANGKGTELGLWFCLTRRLLRASARSHPGPVRLQRRPQSPGRDPLSQFLREGGFPRVRCGQMGSFVL